MQIEKLRAEGSTLQQQLKAAVSQRDREGAAKSLVSAQLVRCQGSVQELQLQLERVRGDVQQAEARGREDAAAEKVRGTSTGRTANIYVFCISCHRTLSWQQSQPPQYHAQRGCWAGAGVVPGRKTAATSVFQMYCVHLTCVPIAWWGCSAQR
jgi:hypothetical protein